MRSPQLLLLLCCAGAVYGFITDTPRHTAAKKGTDPRLNCSVSKLDEHIVFWEGKTMNDTKFEKLFYTVSGPAVDWIQMVPDGPHDIIIPEVKHDKAGSYKCSYFADQMVTVQAELVVLGDMWCGNSGKKYLEGGDLKLVCTVPVTGRMDPQLQWYIEDELLEGGEYIEPYLEEDEVPPPPEEPRPLKFVHNLRVDRSLRGKKITCKLGYSEGTEDNPDPLYTDRCDISFDVLYGPKNVEFTPNPSDFDKSVIVLKDGDVIKCSADANPPPMIMWYKLEGGLQVPVPAGDELVVSADMQGEQRYNCSVMNEPRGQPMYAYKSVRFRVEGGYLGTNSRGNLDQDSHMILAFVLALISSVRVFSTC